jgi:hypothetical protein
MAWSFQTVVLLPFPCRFRRKQIRTVYASVGYAGGERAEWVKVNIVADFN